MLVYLKSHDPKKQRNVMSIRKMRYFNQFYGQPGNLTDKN